MFRDRTQAGERLADLVTPRIAGRTIVLGLARGGVIVAAPVAARLAAPLDVIAPRKLGAPSNPELGIGAIAPGVRVLDNDLVTRLGVADSWLDGEVRRQEAESRRRVAAYRGDTPPPDLRGATAVVVDDGVATGVTARAALAWARAARPSHLVFAVPVAPLHLPAELAAACDDLIVVERPRQLWAVGQWYADFAEVTDEEVVAALAAAS